MKKMITIILLSFLVIIAGFTGCFELSKDKKDESESNDDNTVVTKNVTMTMYEYGEDQKFDTDYSSYFTLYQQSLNEGDTLVIDSNISQINYDPLNNQTNITICEHKWESGTSHGFCETFRFKGNITDEFKIEEHIQITVTIKQVIFSDDGFDYDMEIFEEQWVNDNYFNLRVDQFINYSQGFKPMPTDYIKKLN